MDLLNLFSSSKVIPVIKIEDADNAVPLGKALKDGGLNIAEITFRTDCAAAAIKAIANEFPDIIVGAGTVITVDQVKSAVDSGSKFIVSPGLDKDVVEYCLKNDIPVFPGVITPTELQVAIRMGLNTVKFFPAEAAGGLKYLKAISAPFNNIKFVPTGGINQNNIREYLDFNKVVACGGSWVASSKLIAEKKFDEITSLVKDVVKL